jgi:DNA-binding response OmpR family regulator
MNNPRILTVDDDLAILKLVRANLRADNYEVFTAKDGGEALEIIEKEQPDLIILDIMLPELNGYEVCRQVRAWSSVPIIMLSANGEEENKVRCLDTGADDYITKPFGVDELRARVRALLRRIRLAPTSPAQPVFSSGKLQINFVERRVSIGAREIKLTPIEFNLLQELALNAGKVITHGQLLNKIWGPDYIDERHYLHIFIRRLRMKLKADRQRFDFIQNVSGIGYRFQQAS